MAGGSRGTPRIPRSAAIRKACASPAGGRSSTASRRTESVGQVVFFEATFWLLVLFSFVAPVVIYVVLLRTRSVSATTVLMLALVLIVIAGIDLYLLNRLASMARESASLV